MTAMRTGYGHRQVYDLNWMEPEPRTARHDVTTPDVTQTEVDVSFYGDSSLIVVVRVTHPNSHKHEREIVWARTHAIAAAIDQMSINEVTQKDMPLRTVLAGYDSVFVEFDPLTTDPASLSERVAAAAAVATRPATTTVRRIIIPVWYGNDAGPDLSHVATTLGLSPADVVAAHTAHPLTVRMVASPVGSPMMDVTPELRGVPRRSVPRPRLEAGSVAVAGDQCMIYAGASPGGWNIIGQTPCRLYDVAKPRPPVCRPGDIIEFRSIGADEFEQARHAIASVVDDPT